MSTRNYFLIIFATSIIAFFRSEYKAKSFTFDHTQIEEVTPKITGVGGIFFKAKDPEALRNWYGDNLGISIMPTGSPFEFRNAHRPEEINYLIWSPFPEDTEALAPSEKEFMINYRVQNIDKLVSQLKEKGITIVDEMNEVGYGKFIHILDLEGNKIELWEPIDSFLTELGGPTTK